MIALVAETASGRPSGFCRLFQPQDGSCIPYLVSRKLVFFFDESRSSAPTFDSCNQLWPTIVKRFVVSIYDLRTKIRMNVATRLRKMCSGHHNICLPTDFTTETLSVEVLRKYIDLCEKAARVRSVEFLRPHLLGVFELDIERSGRLDCAAIARADTYLVNWAETEIEEESHQDADVEAAASAGLALSSVTLGAGSADIPNIGDGAAIDHERLIDRSVAPGNNDQAEELSANQRPGLPMRCIIGRKMLLMRIQKLR